MPCTTDKRAKFNNGGKPEMRFLSRALNTSEFALDVATVERSGTGIRKAIRR